MLSNEVALKPHSPKFRSLSSNLKPGLARSLYDAVELNVRWGPMSPVSVNFPQ